MPAAKDILARKGFDVHSIAPDATVLEAVHKMNARQIGCLIVMDQGHVVGIFTERDVLRRVVAKMAPPDQVLVEQAMTREVACCGPETDIDDVSAIMKERRVRHLPVCNDDGDLMGVISIGDVNAYHASNQASEIMFLQDYVFGRG
jgi:CBS domain-containing protein